MSDPQSKILEAASALFLQGGVTSLSVRAIAREAGISTIGIYSHFNGKQGILDALYIEGFNLVYNAMDQGGNDQLAEKKLSFKAKKQIILNACSAYVDVGAQHEAHYRLIFGERDASYMPSSNAKTAANRAFAKLVHVAGSYLGGEKISFAKKQQIALDIWAILHGYVSISHHVTMVNQDVTTVDQNINWKKQALGAVERQLAAY